MDKWAGGSVQSLMTELEDRMVEITAEEQNKGKGVKRTQDSLRGLWDSIRSTNIQNIGISEKDEKKKGYEKFFEEIIVENFPNMGKEIVKSSRSGESPLQVKPKEKHIETHINQANRD